MDDGAPYGYHGQTDLASRQKAYVELSTGERLGRIEIIRTKVFPMGHIIAMAQDAGEIQPTFPKWYKTFTAAMSGDGKGKSHQDGYDRLNAWKLAGRFDELLAWYESLNDKPKIPHASNSPAKLVLWLAKIHRQHQMTDAEIDAEEKAKEEARQARPATAKVLKERLTALVKTVLADDHARAKQLALLVQHELNGTVVKAPLQSSETTNEEVIDQYKRIADEVAAELTEGQPTPSGVAPIRDYADSADPDAVATSAKSNSDNLPGADVSTKPARAKKAGRKAQEAAAVGDPKPDPERNPKADQMARAPVPPLFENFGGSWESVDKEPNETEADYEARLRVGWASGEYRTMQDLDAAMAAPPIVAQPEVAA